jgi:hypothetical protein
MTGDRLERTVALGLVAGWVFLSAATRWSWRFVMGGR